MRKVTCVLAIVAAVATVTMTALPAMAQSSNNLGQNPSNAVVGSQPGQAQVPQPPDGNVNWKGVGIGAGTVAGNVLYMPAKVVYRNSRRNYRRSKLPADRRQYADR